MSTPDPVVAPLRQQDARGRFYTFTDPETGREDDFWSVTTALQAYAKDGLKWWAAKLAAQRAMDNLPMLIMSQRLEPCGNSYKRDDSRCNRCPVCVTRWVELFHLGESTRRKHEGSALHDALEDKILERPERSPAELGQKYIQDHPDIVKMLPPYLETLNRWWKDYAVEPGDFGAAEMTVFNTVHRYGGTLDFLWTIHARNMLSAKLLARITGRTDHRPVTVVGDCKSREGDGKQLYDEHPLQLAPYRWANFCMPDKTTRVLHAMPSTRGAVVLQIRPDGFTCEPVYSGEEEFRTFLGILETFRWMVERGAAAIAVKSFPVPEGFAWPPVGDGEVPQEAKKAAPRKRAAKKAAPAATAAAPAAAPRIAGATLESLANTDRPAGARLTDEDIPF